MRHLSLRYHTPVYSCLSMFICFYLCLPLFTCVYLCLILFICVYLCLIQLTRACVHMFTYVYSCLPIFSTVYSCLPIFSTVYSCLPLFTTVFSCMFTYLYTFLLCLPTFTRVYLFLHLFTYNYPCFFVFTYLYSCLTPFTRACLPIIMAFFSQLLLLEVPRVSASISPTNKRIKTRQSPLDRLIFFLSCHVNNSISRFAAIRLVIQYRVTYFLYSLQINYLHWKLSASRSIFSCYATILFLGPEYFLRLMPSLMPAMLSLCMRMRKTT